MSIDTAIEYKDKLKQILSSHLNKEIDYDNDFFKIGGTSLQAIRVTESINEEFNTDFNIIDFYYNSSVNGMYNLLTGGSVEDVKKSESLVEFLSDEYSNDKDNVFFFPPIIGVGKIFQPLIKHINIYYNCYAINFPTAIGELPLEEIAEVYYEEISYLIKNDKVKNILLGYSEGAIFSFETAKYFSDSSNVKVMLINCQVEGFKINVTKRFIRKKIKSLSFLIELVDTIVTEDEIFKKVEQTLTILNDYEVSGTLNAPIYTFECEENLDRGYMKNWNNHTNDFKETIYLEGDQLQVLQGKNLMHLINFFTAEIL